MAKKTHLLDAMIDQHDAMYCGIILHGGKMLTGEALYALDALSKWQYNEFDGKKVSKWLEKLLLKNAKVQVGREYSPCLYVTIPHLGLNKAGKNKEVTFAQAVMAQGKKLKADEIGMEKRIRLPIAENDDGRFAASYVVRLWWD